MAGPRTALLRVLRAALATAPGWWKPDELGLVASATSLDAESGDLLARLAVRTRRVVRRDEAGLPAHAIATLQLAGWLTPVAPAEDPAGILATLSLAELGHPGPRSAAETAVLGDPRRDALLAKHGPFIAITSEGRRLLDLAQAVAFAGEGDLTLLARIAAGQLVPPAGSPLAGALVELGALPWTDRAACEEWLVAKAAREAGPAFALALEQVRAREGQPLHLAQHHLTAGHHWARLLWASAATSAQRRLARRALRRAPCPPSLMREVWEDLHAHWHPRPAADRLARAFATWSLWSEVDRAAWAARADGTRVARTRVWPVRTIEAWLDHGAARVVAEGETVEDLALRRLAQDGWQGVHAEGGLWLAVAHLLLAMDPCPSVPWCAPLQALPLDWGRWGYGARRRAAITRRAAALIRDPEAALAEALNRLREPLPGFLAAPSAESLTAVVRHLPPRVLVPLLRRVLDAPAEASGLPDLVAWRGDEIAFWEVKSPADQLSAKQRRWLTWLVSEGVTAGVLRIAAKKAVQTTLFATPTAASATARRAPRSSRHSDGEGFRLLLAGDDTQPAAHGTLPGMPGIRLAAKPWRDVRHELPFVDDRLVAVPATAVLIEVREGRKVRLRRWFPIPPGRVLVGALRDEALPEGGIAPCLRLLTRAAGWLLPSALCDGEPVVAHADELSNPTRDWVPHPDEPPPRPEAQADAWGCGHELRDQLTLLGAEPHGVWTGEACVVIATAPACGVLWVASDPRLVRGVLPIG